MHHPRTLGRAWLEAIAPMRGEVEGVGTFDRPAPRPRAPAIALVPTFDELCRQLGERVHRLSREETEAWFAGDEEQRDEARRAIREAVRDHGGGELRDHRGRVIERVV